MYRTSPHAQAPLVSDHPHAIQIVARFRDTVLLVRQLDDPLPRRGVGRILALLGLGAATQWTALVLARLWGLADYALPFAIGLTSVLVLAWAMVERGLWGRIGLRRAPRFLVGDTPDADLPLVHPDLPSGPFPLVRWGGRDYELLFPEAIAGEVEVGAERDTLQTLIADGRARALPELPGCFALPLTPRLRAHLRLGDHAFIVQSIAVAPPVRSFARPCLRSPWALWAGVSLVAHAAFLFVVWSAPPDTGGCYLDVFSSDESLSPYPAKNAVTKPRIWWQPRPPRFGEVATARSRRRSSTAPLSRVFVDVGQSRGVRDKAALRHEAYQHEQTLRSCSVASARGKRARGAVTMMLDVDAVGRVVATRVHSSALASEQVEGCLAEALLHWRFPPPRDARAVIATLPLVYR